MKRLSILIPEATRNYCTNPSIGLDMTGWTALLAGTARVRTLERSRFGRASLHVTTLAAAPRAGAMYTAVLGLTGSPVTGSVYVRGRGLLYVGLRAHTNSLEWFSKPVQLTDAYWQRIVVTGTLGTVAENDLRLAVMTYRNEAADFYVDGAQIELKGHATTYCDGDVELELPSHDGGPYFEWVGQRHATESFRTRTYRKGGRFEDLTQGLDVNLYPIDVSGLGMPPLVLGTQIYSGQEKALVQSVKALPRALGINFQSRRSGSRDECNPQSLKDLHTARRALEAVLKPDLVSKPQVGVIRYEDGPVPMDLDAIYEAGMEWEGDFRDPTINAFGVRLLAPDPYWHSDSQDTAVLDVATTIVGDHAYLIARLSGEWQGFGSASFPIRVLKVHPNGDVYAGGDFLNIGGVACRHIARWDGTQWNILAGAGNDIDNGTVNAIAFAADGDVYIGGTFTTIDGVTMNRMTRYQPDTDTFHQLVVGANPGVTSDVYALAVNRSGQVYVGGVFLTTDSGVTVNRIVRYNGPTLDTWAALIDGGFTGLDATVRCLEMDLDGITLFVGGDFTQRNGSFAGDLPYIAKWTGTAFAEMAELGLNGSCRALRIALDGRLYLGGTFTIAGFWTVAKVAVWNRQEFYPLGGDGDGLTGGSVVNAIEIDSRGNVYFGGDFTGATGDDACAYLAQWNGTRFGHLDVATGAAVDAIASKFDKLFVGYEGAAVSSIADVQTVENHGAATAHPILDVLGPVTLKWLENQETGKVVRFNLAVLAGERVLIDLRPGLLKAVSEWRGNVMSGLLPDSDFGDFGLLPGENRISFHGTDDSGSEEVSLRWALAEWSFDDIR